MNQEEKDDGFMNAEYDNQKENGVHRPQYGKNCKCFDCQEEKRKPNLGMWDKKDRRISWLSIFSSLMGTTDINKIPLKDIVERAYELNEELYKHYPT